MTSLVNHGFREDFHFVHIEASGMPIPKAYAFAAPTVRVDFAYIC